MATLKKAHNELYRRLPDETFATLQSLAEHCRIQRESSVELWHPPGLLMPQVSDGTVQLHMGTDGAYALNHWSLSQLCGLAGVSRDTINKLSPETACRALQETRPSGNKPMQILVNEDTVRAIHGTAYSRLWNADLLDALLEASPGFQPPQKAASGGTGLYAGQEDMFVFLIDPTGWTEIGGEAFAPGFFVWNSEVGRRSLGIQTFWFQAVCMNHIVWDAIEVVDFTRKHTGNVRESLADIQCIVHQLVAKRDERKDGFAHAIRKAMQSRVGNSEDATQFLTKHGITRTLIKNAVAKIGDAGKPFTIFTLVDALTQLTQEVAYAGDRTEADQKISKLLSLAV